MKNRRAFIGKTTLGIFGVIPIFKAMRTVPYEKNDGLSQDGPEIHPLYPTTDPNDIRKVVGAAHTQFEVVKELVTARPELAKSTWDWGYGDWESALGAASHMGRKDIAEFLIEHGARPNIYTFAMLGKLNSVRQMIQDMPGIQSIPGPHGITLLSHAQMRLRRENVEGQEKEQQEALVDYLRFIGDADEKSTALDISKEEQKVYLGKYTFGKGEDEYFEITVNSRGMLFMGRGTYTGRVLLRTGPNSFAPGGAPSVHIVFEITDNEVKSLTIHDPTPILKATRVS